MIRPLKLIVFVLAMVAGGYLVSVFLDANREMVQLRFSLWRTKDVGLGLLVSFSFVLGLAISAGILTTALISKMLESKRLHRENDALQRLLETKTHEPKLTKEAAAGSSKA
jgi:uncharacterized integral membrane protein